MAACMAQASDLILRSCHPLYSVISIHNMVGFLKNKQDRAKKW